jgi:hypothetical protein
MRSGADWIAQCLATAPGAMRKTRTSPGRASLERDGDQPAPERLEQQLAPANLGPVGAVGRRGFGLGAVERAPDAAHEAQAIAAGVKGGGLVAVGGAEPAAGFGEDGADAPSPTSGRGAAAPPPPCMGETDPAYAVET